MKLKFALMAAVLASPLLTAPAHAQMRALSDPVVAHPDPESLFTSSDRKLHRNKQAALRIMRELLQCNQWDRAGEWLTDRYIQHNPLAASGLEAVKHYFINVAKREPTPTCNKLTSPVVAVQAEGDYVTVLAVRTIPYADDPSQSYTTTWFDTWRFVDGKADQHWDPATLPTGPAPQAAATMTPEQLVQRYQDREAIEALMWRYDRSLDHYDAEAYAANFTPDGAFGQIKGHAALKKMITDLVAGQEERRKQGVTIGKMHHFTMNQWLEFTGADTARYHYYHQTVFGTGGAIGSASAPVIAAAGQGVDDLVKVDGKWLIKYRNVAPTREQE
ncbi:MAG TPA: nuclear transport factor 2 family protein [Croceibacterium sp.]|nr:nuclear transport factor 2 family protein [Croceibacterium sp.]